MHARITAFTADRWVERLDDRRRSRGDRIDCERAAVDEHDCDADGLTRALLEHLHDERLLPTGACAFGAAGALPIRLRIVQKVGAQ